MIGDNMVELAKQNAIVAEAKRFLEQGQVIKTGMLIFERIPLELRPEWCANILDLAYRHIEPIQEIETLLDFVKHPEHWPLEKRRHAHHVFDAIRERSLSGSSDEELYQMILSMGENIAGITYTSRQFEAPFDHSRGWYFADDIRRISGLLGDPFAGSAWQMYFDIHYIQLDNPVSCNRGCPICHPPKWDYLPEIQLKES